MFHELAYHHTLFDFKGENIVDDTVWICKTHYPSPVFRAKEADFNKVLCCVRQPLDTLASLMHFFVSFTMDKPIAGEFEKDAPEFWEKFVMDQTDHFKKYHDMVIKDAVEKKVPYYFIRYEDLVNSPLDSLEKSFCFILNVESIEGTVIQKRIREVIGMGHEASVSYKPKGIGINKNADKFNEKLMAHVMKELEEFNYFFGYTNYPEGENPVKIFDYKEHSAKGLEMLNGYQKASEEGLEFCVKNPDKLKDIKYHVNAPD